MPVIQQYVATQQASTDRGGQPSIFVDTSPEQALKSVGASVSVLGNRLAARDDKNEQFEAEKQFNDFNASQALQLEENKRQAEPGAPNFAANGMTQYNEGSIEFLEKIPERLRPQYEARLAQSRGRMTMNYSTAEYSEQTRYQTQEIERITDGLAQTAAADPDNVDGVVEAGNSQIDKSSIAPTLKHAMKRNWNIRAREAAWRGLLISDPVAARKALGVEIPMETPSGPANVVDRILHVESGGKANAKNPLSSATGTGQFIDPTWLDMLPKYRPDLTEGLTRAQILELRKDPKISREMATRYAEENAQKITNAGFIATDGNIYLGHFLGPGSGDPKSSGAGAITVLRAKDDTPLSDILSSGKIKANPFLKGWNAGQLKQWAANKMTGTKGRMTAPDPRFADIPVERRMTLANTATAAVNADALQARTLLESQVVNQVTALQVQGSTEAPTLSLDDFKRAFPKGNAEERFDDYMSARETAEQTYKVRGQSPTQQQSMLDVIKPLDTEDPNYAREVAEYDSLQKAVVADNKAWRQDPVAQALMVNPGLVDMQQEELSRGEAGGNFANTSATTYRDELDAIYDRKQLPARDRRYLTSTAADRAAAIANDPDAAPKERAGAIVSEVFATDDPAQQEAVFRQLVSAGVPEHFAGIMDVFARGDVEGYNNLTLDAFTDTSKLPGKLSVTPMEIDEAIQDVYLSDGALGTIAYSLDMGNAADYRRASMDKKLIEQGVRRRMYNSSSLGLDEAVDDVVRDLLGDVQPITTDSVGRSDAVNIVAMIPDNIPSNSFVRRAQTLLPTFREGMVQASDRAIAVIDANEALDDDQKRLQKGRVMRSLNDVTDNMVLRELPGGFGMVDPATGGVVPGANGAPLVFTLEEIMAQDLSAADRIPTNVYRDRGLR